MGDKELCGTKLCDKAVCDRGAVEEAEEAVEAEEAEEEEAGYRIKNKNPTQRCGESFLTLCKSLLCAKASVCKSSSV